MSEKINVGLTDIYYAKLKEGEISLTSTVTSYISTSIGLEEANIFATSKDIAEIALLNNLTQRVIINKWLSEVLLKFRSDNKVVINSTLVYLVNDGLNEDWLKLLSGSVIPFLKQHNVIKSVYSIKQEQK